MAVAPGEYAFECSECNGDRNIEIGPVDHPDHEWVSCPDCHGDGELLVDQDRQPK